MTIHFNYAVIPFDVFDELYKSKNSCICFVTLEHGDFPYS